jgi:hypothetical protein
MREGRKAKRDKMLAFAASRHFVLRGGGWTHDRPIVLGNINRVICASFGGCLACWGPLADFEGADRLAQIKVERGGGDVLAGKFSVQNERAAVWGTRN